MKNTVSDNLERTITKHSGSPKLFKPTKRADGSFRSLNAFIKESRHPVFTVQSRNKKTGRKFGKALSFKETTEAWQEGIETDCKDQDTESCLTEWESDLPEFCLMGNPRSCINKKTFKLLREKFKTKTSHKDDFTDQYDWIDALSPTELAQVMENEFGPEQKAKKGTRESWKSPDIYGKTSEEIKLITAIREGELIYKAKKSHGRRLSISELKGIKKTLNKAKKRLLEIELDEMPL